MARNLCKQKFRAIDKKLLAVEKLGRSIRVIVDTRITCLIRNRMVITGCLSREMSMILEGVVVQI